MLRFKLPLVLFCMAWFYVPAAHALLGEDYTMVTSYYAAPSRWPPEYEARIDRFAKVQREVQPGIVQLFKNKANQINKQIWVAQGRGWSFAQAADIRNAIMQNRSASQVYQANNKYLFIYPDGSRVIVQYNPRTYLVHTLWAIDKDFDPGDRGVFPKAFWEKARVFPPQS